MSDDPLMDLCLTDPEVAQAIRGARERALQARVDVAETNRVTKVFLGDTPEPDPLRWEAYTRYVDLQINAGSEEAFAEALGPYCILTPVAEPERSAPVIVRIPPCMDHG